MKLILGRIYIAVALIGIAVILLIAINHYRNATVTVVGTLHQIQTNSLVTGEPVTLVDLLGRDGCYYTLGLNGVDNDFVNPENFLELFSNEIEVTFSKNEVVARADWKQELLDKYKLSNPLEWYRIKSYKIIPQTP